MDVMRMYINGEWLEAEGKFDKGYLIEPTVFLDCDNSMWIVSSRSWI